MSTAALHATAFYREVAASGRVYTLRNAEGCPSASTPDGKCAVPFWSSRSRAEVIAQTVPAYAGYEVEEIPWDWFCKHWAEDLAKNGFGVGLNWHGPRAQGYDREPRAVVESVRRYAESGGE